MSDISQIVSQWELYRLIQNVSGVIVECGVFKGRSLLRWASFSKFYDDNRRLIGFDTFDTFPKAQNEGDAIARAKFIQSHGDTSSSTDEIKSLLNGNCELVKGDICSTVPEYALTHPILRIALLNMDCDLYEPARAILEHFYPLLAEGGILICDDYKIFPGETKAVNEFCQKHNLEVQCSPMFVHYYLAK